MSKVAVRNSEIGVEITGWIRSRLVTMRDGIRFVCSKGSRR